jgi:hypothetical protein
MADDNQVDEFYFRNDQQVNFKNKGPLVVKIKIYELTGELIRDHKRDIRKGKNKDWMIGAILWAVQNQKRVEIERKM